MIVKLIIFLVLIPSISFAWTFDADFDSGILSQPAEGTSGISDAYGTTNIFDNTQYHSGTQSMRTQFDAGLTGSSTTGGAIAYSSVIANGGEVWARYYLYVPSDFNWTCNPVVKVFRFAHIYTSADVHQGYISIFANSAGEIQLSNEVDGQSNHERGTGVYYTKGGWQQLDMYAKADPVAGIVRIWKDGVLIREETNYPTLGNITDKYNGALIWTYWNGNIPVTQYAWADDIVVTSDRPTHQDSAGNYLIGPTAGSNLTPTSSLSPLPGRYATRQTVTVTTTGSTVLTCTGAAPCTPATAYTAPVPVYPDDYLCTSTDGGAAVCGQYRFPVRCH